LIPCWSQSDRNPLMRRASPVNTIHSHSPHMKHNTLWILMVFIYTIWAILLDVVSYVDYENGMVFTGDALLIRVASDWLSTGYQTIDNKLIVKFSSIWCSFLGDSGLLYESIHNKIFTLPEHFRCIFPHMTIRVRHKHRTDFKIL